jgi:hypothetical protein
VRGEFPTAERVSPRLLDCRAIKRPYSEVLREREVRE